MLKTKSFTFFFIAVVAAMLAVLLYLGYFVSVITQPVSSSSEVVTFSIDKGDGVNQISERLFDAGLIGSKWNFEVYVWLKRWASHLQAGEYRIPKNVSIQNVAGILFLGKDGAAERNITIIEGWTIDDMAGYLDREGVVSEAEFKEAADRLMDKPLVSALADKPAGASLEGYLFPDTYRIFKGTTAEEIILKMLVNFDAKLTAELRADITARGQTIYNTVVMASILEREVRHVTDLALVADIFYKRLAAGKALESDATLNYVLPAERRRAALTAEDLKNQSSYNTYIHTGLPPSPISNPGIKAIEAAANPKSNPYWFFLTTPEGEAIFSNTYAEHLKNKQLYLK